MLAGRLKSGKRQLEASLNSHFHAPKQRCGNIEPHVAGGPAHGCVSAFVGYGSATDLPPHVSELKKKADQSQQVAGKRRDGA